MLEAAMVLPFVLFFLFVSIDLFIFAFQAVAAQFVAGNLMRTVSTSSLLRTENGVSVTRTYDEARARSRNFFLKLEQPDAQFCLCPIREASDTGPEILDPSQCLNANHGGTYCRSMSRSPADLVIQPGENFILILDYAVPQLFSKLFKQVYRVQAVSMGRVEPMGVSQ